MFDHDKYLGKPYRLDALVPVDVEHEDVVKEYAREPEQVIAQSKANMEAGLKETADFLSNQGMRVFLFSQVPKIEI